jgi:hypothetical protein
VKQRTQRVVNLEQYGRETDPVSVGRMFFEYPREPQRILRMLVQSPYSRGLRLPAELAWVGPALALAEAYQKHSIRVSHPFTYITVRHGEVNTRTDDEWHVDGFSTRYAHLPEANYILVSGDHPTEWVDQRFTFPNDFDPLKHNVHKFFQKRVYHDFIRQLKLDTLYFVDPYVVHRRPPVAKGTKRTFIRISFTPIEIPDVNNTWNPEIPTTHYVTDGIKDFRDNLKDYDHEN